ncbi:hypothetical protein ABEB36_002738 [Hypothenemus hampei]|uniref:5'-3' exoribonuclease 1 n=1 Tax=Hypothenemus hampei TaxID=57062 RepID=A0ABD1F7G3_HYPHA
MGVPKFFRYISERYPCLSELVREYQIPEFDNMYLDMNGIIHMCSHPDDNNPHFRITEEKIFQDIFHYIEVLFRMIRPQKLFFMAIDGVAPRAKMNQQRGRRFRAAKDAVKQEQEAQKKGETLPTEARFDSNCITPGTVFMARLHEQLKYFCTEKISNDPLWRDVKVILSGHETPGEGEHKIMDYIRYLRSQPGYDPNTRHCLYGLDADLIMLGLCTHDPHFSLLREEVKFGRKSTKRQSVPEEITFYLLHLSLMREYLELEFAPIKDKLVGFEYDLEKIIDDWVLMGFLVGNDFIPNLPNLHIANGALPILYKTYMEVLPTLDGYINEGGNLNLPRFEKLMQKLANFDIENFEEIRDDLLYMESKTGRKFPAHSKITSLRELQEWEIEEGNDENFESLEPELGKQLRDSELDALIKATEQLDVELTEDDLDEDEDDDDLAFRNFKKEYYMNKLDYSKVTPEVLKDQAEGYVRAIQWNLNYYYNGCCSWSWYYPHHYAPYISDIKGFSDLKFDFELGTPFKPYEQLLAVLPEASKSLLPEAYRHLMTSDESLIKKYYPEDFQTDKNGKKQEWEAVVLIPFMDEKLLLNAMKSCNENLSPDEQKRNTHGPMLVYTYSHEDLGKYDASEYFPAINHNHSKMETLSIQDIRVPKEKLIKGAYPGACFDVYYPGFPTMKHLKFKAEVKKAKVKVFEQPSRSENMVLQIIQEKERAIDDVPVELIGANVFVGWPHLIEGRVTAISNNVIKYISMGEANQYNTEDIQNPKQLAEESAGVIERYKTRLGIEVGQVDFLCTVQIMTGRTYVFSPNGRLTLQKQFSTETTNYPLQTIVSNINTYDSHHTLFRDIEEVYPVGEICFTLSNPYYGAQGVVVDNNEVKKTGRIKIGVSIAEEPNFEPVMILREEILKSYKPLFNAASQVGMSHFLYSRITGTIFVEIPDGEGGFKNINVGLDLKFNKKNKETPGYTKRIGSTWYYTNKCTELVRAYSEKFFELFKYLSDNIGYDSIKPEHVFKENWEEKVKELQKYLKSLPTYNIERQQCGSKVTEEEVVKEIEKIVDEHLKTLKFKKVTMSIKPAFLYKPELQTGTLSPDPKMQAQLFDRIVNTRKGFTIPFGLKGTIIAITESSSGNERDTMYDVIFDKPFKDGMQLNCSPGRGYRLPKTAFINISYGKRLYEQKTGKDGNLAAMAESNKKAENPWQTNNGHKLFTQLSNSYRQIPDQYPKPPPQNRRQGSAFAAFSHSTKNDSREQRKNRNNYSNNSKSTPINKENVKTSEINNSKALDYLLPKFANSRSKVNTTDDTKAKNQEDEAEAKENLRETSAKSNKKPSTTSADFLKNLLKVSDSSSDDHMKHSDNAQSLNVSFEILAKQVAKTPPTVRLLTYFSSNGLGLPRYQHFQSGNRYKAQITLPNGEFVVSQACNTKEEASENVATEVLQMLMKKTSSLPVPPKTWVEPVKMNDTPESKSTSDQALKTALHNPFVPTQVIKRQSSKLMDANEEKKETQVKLDGRKHQADITSVKNLPANQPVASRSRKSKKTRIAANFGKNP